ncbi:MAG: tetratricopeptide repeat protein [Luminiphilus sp.]|nr:tetratricopeptide repeat protein [Luminiphilus sp.]MDG2037504.1 tetratricopeptide repeat protein [Luminiphilus sp.]
MTISSLFRVSVLTALVLCGALGFDQAVPGIVFSEAVAQDKPKKDTRETRRTPALRNKVYERLAEAQGFAEAKDYASAEAILNDMISEDGKRALNSYELANVYNLHAFLSYVNEDYAQSLRYYGQVIAQPDIPLAMEINTRFTVAQLYFVQEQWQQGIDALLTWFDLNEKPNAGAYVLLAQGYYQVKDYNLALKNVETAIGMHEGEGKLPKEQWYNLARFLYFDREDFDSALDVLNTLIIYYPKKQYWVQASHLYGEKKDEPTQLALMEAAYEQGFLDRSSELVTMSYLYLNAETPYYAGAVMQKGFADELVEDKSKNFELAGSAWAQAREVAKSIPMMEKAAAKSEEGELYVRLGNVYLDGDQFSKSADSIIKGLNKGGVKRPDQARLALGMAYFNLGDYDEARKAFRAAGKDGARRKEWQRSQEMAQQWIAYVTSEEDRQRELEKDLF